MLASKQVIIGLPEHRILIALGRYDYLTSFLLCLLYWSLGSASYVRKSLAKLSRAGFVGSIKPIRTVRDGSFPLIYFLNRKGYNYLVNIGQAPEIKFRSPQDREREAHFLIHSIEANTFLVLTANLAKKDPRIVIADMKTERELKRYPIKVADSASKKSEKITVVNDGWMNLTIHNTNEFPIALELDRGSEQSEVFKKKIRGLVEYDKGAYQASFGTQYLTVLFVITRGGEKRLKDAIRWTEEELTKLKDKSAADLFRFALMDMGTVDPEQVFYSPIWRRPFTDQPVALIGGS